MKTPYEEMARMAVDDLRAYETMIVRVRVDGIEMNEILEFNGSDLSWCWLNDWYEGQHNVEYIGSIRLSEVLPVVLCKDCVHSKKGYGDRLICCFWNYHCGNSVFEDGFCNYGRKREET